MITVVSGLPRSGTSLLMQMLRAGGHAILCDEERPPDAHNPRGYFEYRKVRGLERDSTWLAEAEGKAVKIVSPLLPRLPERYEYRVIFMRRDLEEVLGSQEQMLTGLGQPAGPSRDVMRAHFERHLRQIEEWLPSRPEIRVFNCSHADVLRSPETLAREIAAFLGLELDVSEMVKVVDPALHRQKNRNE